jgi:hypothetical protein
MSEDNIVQLNTAKTTDDAWDKDIVRLQGEMNIAALIKEQSRLEAYFYEMGADADDDDESSDRQDNVRDAINKTIYSDTHIIALTKWGRPVLNNTGLDRLVEGLSDVDKAVVRNFVEVWFNNLTETYEWKLAGALAPRQTLRTKSVIAKLRAQGAEKPEEPQVKKRDNIFDDVNCAARMIVANVLRRLICSQAEDYQQARAILDAAELSEEARKIVEEEPHIVAALYACAFHQHGQLRRDDRGKPLGQNFVDGKLLNLKENPYKGQETMVLRGLFMDLRMKMGGKNEYQKPRRQIFRELQRPALALEEEQNEIADVELEAA